LSAVVYQGFRGRVKLEAAQERPLAPRAPRWLPRGRRLVRTGAQALRHARTTLPRCPIDSEGRPSHSRRAEQSLRSSDRLLARQCLPMEQACGEHGSQRDGYNRSRGFFGRFIAKTPATPHSSRGLPPCRAKCCNSAAGDDAHCCGRCCAAGRPPRPHRCRDARSTSRALLSARSWRTGQSDASAALALAVASAQSSSSRHEPATRGLPLYRAACCAHGRPTRPLSCGSARSARRARLA
jgi:hypothetical protein